MTRTGRWANTAACSDQRRSSHRGQRFVIIVIIVKGMTSTSGRVCRRILACCFLLVMTSVLAACGDDHAGPQDDAGSLAEGGSVAEGGFLAEGGAPSDGGTSQMAPQ